MFRRDRRGRLRHPAQEKGLRPLYPPLEAGWQSRALRMAMPVGLWMLFDRLVGFFPSPTQARSNGEAIAYLLRQEERDSAQWLDWDQEKQLRLLTRSSAADARKLNCKNERKDCAYEFQK